MSHVIDTYIPIRLYIYSLVIRYYLSLMNICWLKKDVIFLLSYLVNMLLKYLH